jgi:regulator of protease activity HflC (stomatin/prohibitin superfamily)
MRRTEVAVTGRELMTKDKVSLRLSLTVAFAIEDAVVATHKGENAQTAVYTAVQLAPVVTWRA